jgi:hypothetical protein
LLCTDMQRAYGHLRTQDARETQVLHGELHATRLGSHATHLSSRGSLLSPPSSSARRARSTHPFPFLRPFDVISAVHVRWPRSVDNNHCNFTVFTRCNFFRSLHCGCTLADNPTRWLDVFTLSLTPRSLTHVRTHSSTHSATRSLTRTLGTPALSLTRPFARSLALRSARLFSSFARVQPRTFAWGSRSTRFLLRSTS